MDAHRFRNFLNTTSLGNPVGHCTVKHNYILFFDQIGQNGRSPIEAIYLCGSHTSYNTTNLASPVGCNLRCVLCSEQRSLRSIFHQILLSFHILLSLWKEILSFIMHQIDFLQNKSEYMAISKQRKLLQRKTCLFRKLIIGGA